METIQSAKEPSLRQSKTALLEAAQAAVADQRTRASDPIRPARAAAPARTVFRVFLLLVILAGGTILILRPAWLIAPGLPPETGEVQAASATLALVEAVSHVKAFAASKGRLPGRLEEAGVTNPGITLRPMEGTEFEVSLAAAGSTISLRSTDSLKAIVVAAVRTLQGRS